jgi:murein DD-endopeptidase MepM/ murein hydrolase activator NlpD
MAESRYTYNSKTLKYERTGISILGLSFRGLGYVVFGALFFVGLVIVQNYFIETPLEKSLRAENEALTNHKIILTASLQESNTRIESLSIEDQKLYERLFETKHKATAESNPDKKEEILAVEPELFSQWEASIRSQTKEFFQKARTTSAALSEKIHLDFNGLQTLKGIPTLSPIAKLEADKLVSGFGKRINPFHKGLYHHDGVDIAQPIGTAIIASAPGKITLANTSDQIAGFGNHVEIDHGNGIITRYAHMGELKVRYGQSVRKGQLIGTVGSSGGSIAPHLHYEIIRNGKNANPIHYLIEGFSSTKYASLVQASMKENQSLD